MECRNCGVQFEGAYCPACGQRSGVHLVTFRETFQDFWDFVFSVNAPLFVTLKLLIANPGKLFREYLAGRRKTYYKPVAFFILLTVLHILLRSIVGFDALRDVTPYKNEAIDTTRVVEAARFMFENINNLLFFYVLTLGLFLKLMFYKRHSLAEFIAVAFYLVGFYILIGTFNIFYMRYINPEVQYLAIFAMAIYLIYALVSFLKRPVLAISIKTLIANALAFIFYVGLSFGLSYLIVVLS